MGGRIIRWLSLKAESLEDEGWFDLVTAGCSIHFPDPVLLFPKLARWTKTFAVLDDAPTFPDPPPPCGADAWLAFLTEWQAKAGRPRPRWVRDLERSPTHPHEVWMDIAGCERFAFTYRQSVADFVAGQHARVSWNRTAMGASLVRAFDEALAALMGPYAKDGMLEIAAVSELVWGRPLEEPRATAG
jgi:sarcosine oxidase delta subunit